MLVDWIKWIRVLVFIIYLYFVLTLNVLRDIVAPQVTSSI